MLFTMSERETPGVPTDPSTLQPNDQGVDKRMVDSEAAPSEPSCLAGLWPPPESALTDQRAPTPLSLPPKPSDTREMVGQVLVERYRLVDRLGAGGMGTVFQARDEELNIDVALKILPEPAALDRAAVDRFRREASLVRSIQHKGVCRVYEYRGDGPTPFFTMELIDGRRLRDVMREDKPTTEEVYELLSQVAEALDAVHANRVVHRDLKPENVLVRRSTGEAVLVDFGLAKHSPEQGVSTTDIIGTTRYMSPEQHNGGHLDVRTDVFSFGVMAFELLSGKPPFGSGSDAQVISAVLRDEPARFECGSLLPEVVRGLQSFFDRALAKSPTNRFASAAKMRVALKKAWAGRIATRARSELSVLPNSVSRAPRDHMMRNGWMFLLWIAGGLLFNSQGISAAIERISTARPTPGQMQPIRSLRKDFLACDPVKPTVGVLPFKNSSGESKLDSFADDIAISLRERLLRLPNLHIAEPFPRKTQRDPFANNIAESLHGYLPELENFLPLLDFGTCPTTWLVDGSVQRSGDKVRLSVEVHDSKNALLVPTIEVDDAKGDSSELFDRAWNILVDDLSRQARLKERNRQAYIGTNNAYAQKNLVDYYRLVGPNPQPTTEELEIGKKLVNDALALDPDYVPALVEKAYLLSLGASSTTRSEGVESGLRDLDRALFLQPDDLHALEMRCSLSREAVEVDEIPNDAAIDSALATCDKALQKDPTSGQVRLTYARLYKRMCDEVP